MSIPPNKYNLLSSNLEHEKNARPDGAYPIGFILDQIFWS
jgi:hypothetical protein